MLLMPPVVRVRGAAGADGDSRVCAGVRGLVIEVRFILFLSFFNTVIEVRRLQGEGTVENMGDWVFFRARARALLGRLNFFFSNTAIQLSKPSRSKILQSTGRLPASLFFVLLSDDCPSLLFALHQKDPSCP